MNNPHIPFLKILFALLSVVGAYIYFMKHSDNYEPTQVIYNDGYAKMGGSGYNPFKEAPKAEEVVVPANDEAMGHDAAHEDAHEKGTPHKDAPAPDGKKSPEHKIKEPAPHKGGH